MNISLFSSIGGRESNQDSLYADDKVFSNKSFMRFCYQDTQENIQLFALADGAGGEECGDEISNMVLILLQEKMKVFLDSIREIDLCEQRLLDTISKIQDEVCDFINFQNVFGATTLSALMLYQGKYIAVNIGDSPIYIIKGKKKIPICNIDTIAELKLRDNVPKAEIEDDDYHCLTQAIGSLGYKNIYSFKGTYEKDDSFLLMSDGMNGLNKRQIKSLFNKKINNRYNKMLSKIDDNLSAILIEI